MLILPPGGGEGICFSQGHIWKGGKSEGRGQGADVMKENNWGSVDQKNILGGSVKQ